MKQPRAFAWLALAGVIGLALLGWQWRMLVADLMLLRNATRPLAGILRPTPNHAVTLAQVTRAIQTLWPTLWRLWMEALLLAPMVASYLHTSKVKTAEELERERAAYLERRAQAAILNRLMLILDFSEPYYRDMTKMLLSLAVDAPPGPPRSSTELLLRLNLDELARRYTGMPEARELTGIRATDAQAAYNRYRAFFKALGGGLDGDWAFEDVPTGYIQTLRLARSRT